MKIAVKDLEMALEYIKRRSTDVHVEFITHVYINTVELVFYDIDDNRTVIQLYDEVSKNKPRVSQQDYLDIAVKNLKKP